MCRLFISQSIREDGRIASYEKLYEGAPDQVVKRIVMDMDSVSYPMKPVVPFVEVVHDRSVIELFRGCTRAAGFVRQG